MLLDKNTYKTLLRIESHEFVTLDQLCSILGCNPYDDLRPPYVDEIMCHLETGQLKDELSAYIYYLKSDTKAEVQRRFSEERHRLITEILAVITAMATAGTFFATLLLP